VNPLTRLSLVRREEGAEAHRIAGEVQQSDPAHEPQQEAVGVQRRDAVHDGHDEQHGMRGDAVGDAREKCVGEEELTSESLGVRRDAAMGYG
jgi:hypothetical protein